MAKEKQNLSKEDEIKLKVQREMEMEDFKKRVGKFNKEFIPLAEKYKIGLIARPVFVQQSEPPFAFVISAQSQWIDDKKRLDEMESQSNQSKSPKNEDEGGIASS